jgi:hypothetical protein
MVSNTDQFTVVVVVVFVVVVVVVVVVIILSVLREELTTHTLNSHSGYYKVGCVREAVGFSETSPDFYRITQRHIPEHDQLVLIV